MKVNFHPLGPGDSAWLGAYLVGGPANLAMQRITGGSSPGESSDSSHWRPFNDDNGVSGHAFIGAVPFLTLAGMSDSKFSVYLSYAASTLAGLSRINDNAHFPSQVFLGWFMAFEATGSVRESDKQGEKGGEKIRYSIIPSNDGVVAQLGWRW